MLLDALPMVVPVAGAVIVAAVLSHLVGRLMLRAGSRMLDLPGPRSSHSEPTPRGGGVGIVLVGLLAVAALAVVGVWPLSVPLTLCGFALVAAIGTLDDIRHRPVLLRLALHILAAAMLVVALRVLWDAADRDGLVIAAAVLALVWSINLHNFMDGIDGLLVAQTIWSGLVYAVLFVFAGVPAPALFALLLAAAAAGFLPLNLPRARIFLGDGASGFIGLAIGWLALHGAVVQAISLPESLIIASAFLVDSGATLALRIARGERFWQAHREHLYQVLVRRGHRHVKVTGWYMLWNIAFALPALSLAHHAQTSIERWTIALIVMIVALVVWITLRRWRAHAPVDALDAGMSR